MNPRRVIAPRADAAGDRKPRTITRIAGVVDAGDSLEKLAESLPQGYPRRLRVRAARWMIEVLDFAVEVSREKYRENGVLGTTMVAISDSKFLIVAALDPSHRGEARLGCLACGMPLPVSGIPDTRVLRPGTLNGWQAVKFTRNVPPKLRAIDHRMLICPTCNGGRK